MWDTDQFVMNISILQYIKCHHKRWRLRTDISLPTQTSKFNTTIKFSTGQSDQKFVEVILAGALARVKFYVHYREMISYHSLVARRFKTLPWLRHYNSTGCFGYRPNKGLITNATIPGTISICCVGDLLFCVWLVVNDEILANRIRAPNLWQLVLAYREHGHTMASLDPLVSPVW